ncbi:hypothetical protein [Poseidonibacter antarcticus]|uniref:hypothetical protein n=1 Tax=Poseidonibacter antarcticus TaxID=2478538 RepID=UPI000EF520B6|nr:hypothetical protein [Poseidonibacter antarcticus]
MSFISFIFWLVIFIGLMYFIISHKQKIEWFDDLFNEQTPSTTQKLKLFRGIGYFLFLVMLYSIFISIVNGEYTDIMKALTPIGVLISALLASFSVIANIENTNENAKKQTYLGKLEIISLELHKVFENINQEIIEKRELDSRSLQHIKLLCTIYTPKLLPDFEKFQNRIDDSRKNVFSDEKGNILIPSSTSVRGQDYPMYKENAKFEASVLKNMCSSLQAKIITEMNQYL